MIPRSVGCPSAHKGRGPGLAGRVPRSTLGAKPSRAEWRRRLLLPIEIRGFDRPQRLQNPTASSVPLEWWSTFLSLRIFNDVGAHAPIQCATSILSSIGHWWLDPQKSFKKNAPTILTLRPIAGHSISQKVATKVALAGSTSIPTNRIKACRFPLKESA